MLTLKNLKGTVSVGGGRDRCTQIRSAQQSLRASSGLGIVPCRRQKILDDWSLFEGAEKVREI